MPSLLYFFELVLACSADRAYPIIGYFLERRSRLYTAVGVAQLWVIDIPANSAFVFRHFGYLLLSLFDVAGSCLGSGASLNLMVVSVSHWFTFSENIRSHKFPDEDSVSPDIYLINYLGFEIS